jgi:hypothetical protein
MDDPIIKINTEEQKYVLFLCLESMKNSKIYRCEAEEDL